MQLDSRTLKKHGMRISAVTNYYGNKPRYALVVSGEHNGEQVEWRREFATRKEAKIRAARLLLAWETYFGSTNASPPI